MSMYGPGQRAADAERAAAGSPFATEPPAPPAPDVRVYFLGAISHSQVAINCGTVTQTMVEEFTDTYLGGTAPPVLPGPEGRPGESGLPHREPQTAAATATATDRGVPGISAEIFCRTYLPFMLDDLQRRIPELGLSRAAKKALELEIAGLRVAVTGAAVDMEAVSVGLGRVSEALRAVPQNGVGLPDDPQDAAVGEGER